MRGGSLIITQQAEITTLAHEYIHFIILYNHTSLAPRPYSQLFNIERAILKKQGLGHAVVVKATTTHEGISKKSK